jgi:hypothetical protein
LTTLPVGWSMPQPTTHAPSFAGGSTFGYAAGTLSAVSQPLSTIPLITYVQRDCASVGLMPGSKPLCVADGIGCLMTAASTAASATSSLSTDLPK